MRNIKSTIFLLLLIVLIFVKCNQPDGQGKIEKKDSIVSNIIENCVAKDSPTLSNKEEKENVLENTLVLFKKRDIEKIAKVIKYPLKREFPLLAINNEQEMIVRFAEVFDEYLSRKIANSTLDQWIEMGWRGTMLDDGLVWMENSDGIITAVNYQSDVEKKMLKDLIASDKEKLYISLKTFQNPIYRLKTKTYLIRIDELSGGKYRFASWKADDNESNKPDVTLSNVVFQVQ